MKKRSTFVVWTSAAIVIGSFGLVSAVHATVQDDQAVLRDYLTGNGFLNRGMYDLAAAEYRKFLGAHRDHDKAPLARYGLAVALFRQQQYRESAQELALLQADDRFEFAAESALMLGQSKLALSEWDEAAQALNRVVEKFARHDLADDAAGLQAEALYRARQYDRVNRAVGFIERQAPESPLRERAELFDGLAAMALDRHDDAVARFEGMLERFPDGAFAARVSLLLARSYQATDDLEQSRRQYEIVIRAGHADFVPEALYSLAAMLRRDEEPRKAGQLLDRLFNECPESALVPIARLERGRAYFDEADFDKAYDQFEMLSGMTTDQLDAAAYWLAKCDLRLGRTTEASERLGEAIAEFPESRLRAEMSYDRAVALLRANNSDDAIDALREFRRNFPEHELSEESLRLLAATAHQTGDYDRSVTWCREFLKEYPQAKVRADIEFLVAENLFLQGRLDEAAAQYRQFIADNDEHAQTENAHFRLGMCLYRGEKFDDAVAELRIVAHGTDTKVQHQAALLALGNIAFAKDDWSQAADRFVEYVAFGWDSPNADDALMKLGLSRQREGKVEQALLAYEKLLSDFDDSPHRLQAYFEQGQAQVSLDRPADAAKAFERVLAIDAKSRFAPFAINHLGTLAMREARYEDAEQWYARLSDAEGVSDDLRAESTFQRAQAMMQLGRYADAENAFTSVSTSIPDHSRAAVSQANAALCMARQGDHQRALDALQGVSPRTRNSLDPSLQTTLLYEQAWCERELGQKDRAIQTYQRILKTSDGHRLGTFSRVEIAELQAGADLHQDVIALLRPLQSELVEMPDALRERSMYRYAASQYELEHFDEAAKAFSAFIDRFEKSDLLASATLLCGESFYRLDQHAKAVERLNKAAELTKDDPKQFEPALLRLGECEAALQRWDRSREVFARFLESFPDSELWFQAKFGIGWAEENRGRYDDAIARYREVINRHQGPTAARAQFQIGECLFAQNKLDAAVAELMKVDILYAYPEWSAAALYEAGRCFEAMNQIGQARQQFEQVRTRYAESNWAKLAGERITALSRTNLPGRGGE